MTEPVNIENATGCLICGAELRYTDEYHEARCSWCEGMFQSNVVCVNGHFICDACHSRPASGWIESYCNRSGSVNPLGMATEIMRSPLLKMHGPEHHFLVPAVLISAYCNRTGNPDKRKMISLARKRAEKVPGGFCGTHGNCGAGVGTGIFVNVITHATPLSTETWRLGNLLTGRSLIAIAERGGPRCCKRDTYLAILEAIKFLKEQFQVGLEEEEILCGFSENNRECLKEGCLFYAVP
jgi:hypothetical protein